MSLQVLCFVFAFAVLVGVFEGMGVQAMEMNETIIWGDGEMGRWRCFVTHGHSSKDLGSIQGDS